MQAGDIVYENRQWVNGLQYILKVGGLTVGNETPLGGLLFSNDRLFSQVHQGTIFLIKQTHICFHSFM